MKPFKADLHIHSCLSPCADLDMSPRAIVERSLERGLDIIAICDHNSAENIEASMRAGMRYGLSVLPGMEINSREEVHIIAIFNGPEEALVMQSIVYKYLYGLNKPEVFGEQLIVNEFDEVEGFNEKMLIGAVELGLHEIIEEIHLLGGLAIASHIDRPSFSIISQLGFIPDNLGLDAVELSGFEKDGDSTNILASSGDIPAVTFSDAHFLGDIGRVHTSFVMEGASVNEIRMALSSEAGRGVYIN